VKNFSNIPCASVRAGRVRSALIIVGLCLASCSQGTEAEDLVATTTVQAGSAVRVVSTDVSATALTIYPNDLALVTETRLIDVPVGRSTIAFEGVSDLIIPQSLFLQSFTGVSLERNFDYDLLGRTALFEKSVGKTLNLTRIDAASGEVLQQTAEIVSADSSGGVVVETDDGLEGLFCSGLEVQESFDELPPGLAAKPVMSIEVEAETAGKQEVVISYLTSGFNWEADYRLDLGETDSLLGWLSLDNRTATGYKDAALSVIAGQVQRGWQTQGVEVQPKYLQGMCWPRGTTKRGVFRNHTPSFGYSSDEMLNRMIQPAPMMAMEMAADEVVVTGARMQRREAKQEELGDYKLYRMPMPITVAPYQTKQLAFLSADEAEVERLLYYSLDQIGGGAVTPLTVRYDVDNDKDGALAKPLPEGNVRVFAPSATVGRAYVGEDRIEDTPIGLPAKIEAGTSVTVFAQSNQIDDERYSLTLSNAGESAADVIMDTQYWIKTRVTTAERDEDEDIPTWRVSVPANESVTLEVRLKR